MGQAIASRGWRRRLMGGAIAVAAVVSLAWGAAAPASAATQQGLDATIKSGLKKRVADDVILSGSSTSKVPAGSGKKEDDFWKAFGNGLGNPDVAPPGANDWNCKASDGRTPVVLVHGTWENAYNNWAYLSPYLKRAGMCVFALNYGILSAAGGGGLGSAIPGAYGTGDIAQSAEQLASFVDRVRSSTGASKVNIVGHSQGGLVVRQYLKFDGGADKVDRLVTLGATNHGTTLLGIGTLGRLINNAGIDVLGPIALGVGVSGIQQVYDSEFLKKLNAGGDTVPGVKYTVIGTKYDEVTTPYQSTFLNGPDVRNITLQDGCGIDTSDHLALSYSLRAVSIVLNTFSAKIPVVPGGPGVPVPVVCSPNAWLFG
ncbi:alpha/beta fold hydrolase [Streptomyces sp. SID6673]|nr:alpha/beta fold hydrolase [Streptomyces sp. SID11726]NEB25348.1 alpha/beta fold hydrolase [Streptomyces sp. SID6673]